MKTSIKTQLIGLLHLIWIIVSIVGGVYIGASMGSPAIGILVGLACGYMAQKSAQRTMAKRRLIDASR